MIYLLTIIVVILLTILLIVKRIAVINLTTKNPQDITIWLKKLTKQNKLNGYVLISKNNKIIVSQSCGYHFNSSKELDEHASFNLAPVSKHFTAFCILILLDRKKLNLDQSISDFIPEHSKKQLSKYSNITIKHLLHHTSGLPDYMRLVMKHNKSKSLVTTKTVIDLLISNHQKLAFNPGDKFQYSNTGYVLLAYIVEIASKQSFETFIKDNIFNPLNMYDSQVFNLLTKNQEPTNRVLGYKRHWLSKKQIKRDLNYFDGVMGDGSVYSSAHDLNLWHQALQNQEIISTQSFELMYASGVLNNGKKTNYAMGWGNVSEDIVAHSGGWQGFSSYYYRDMKQNLMIVILDNSSNVIRVSGFGWRFNSIAINLTSIFKI